MKKEIGWAGAVEISETDIVLIAGIYNDCVAKIDPIRFKLNLKGDFTLKPWCKDIINLIRLINKINAKPRLFIQAQLAEYKRPFPGTRLVPSVKMMTTPAAIERYERFCEKMGMTRSKVHNISTEEMNSFSEKQMKSIMENLGIASEEEFFKDPYLVAQLSKTFIQSNSAFQALEKAGYYK